MVRWTSRFGRWLAGLAVAGIFCPAYVRADDSAPRIAAREAKPAGDGLTNWLTDVGLSAQMAVQQPSLVERLRHVTASLAAPTDQELQAQAQRLGESVEALDKYLEGWGSGAGWRKYLGLAGLREALASESALGDTARWHVALAKFTNPALGATHREAFKKPAFQRVQAELTAHVGLLNRRDPAVQNALRARVGAILAAVQAYEETGSQESARAIRELAEAKAAAAGSVERLLAEEVRRLYFQPNVRVTLTQSLLQRFAGDSREDRGPVNDWLAGAEIVGTQVTRTTSRIELHPSSQRASFSLVLDGTTDSSTTAYKDPARIYGSSHSEFVARKRLELTPTGLRALPAEVDVLDTHNEILGADTSVGGLFSGIARNTAMKRARERRPDAEALAARRVRERVSKRLNAEVDAAVVLINQRLNAGLLGGLRKRGIVPASQTSRSTANEIAANAAVFSDEQLAAPAAAPALPKGADLAIQIHQSAVNNSLDRLPLAGQTFEAAQLKERLRGALSEMVGKLREEPAGQDALEGKITFAQRNPLRVQFVEGHVELIVQAQSFEKAGITTPPQTIRVRYQPRMDGKQLLLARTGEIDIQATEPAGGQTASTALVSLAAARNLAVAAVLKAPMERLFRAQMDVPADQKVTTSLGKVVPLKLTAVEANDGWLTVAVR